jgi:23S rRNA pseudouridine2605 synthase
MVSIRLCLVAPKFMVRRMTSQENTDQVKGERIAKALARAGVGSRRDVERMIEEGRISLDGKKLETPATLVTSLDGIRVDGELIEQAAETRVWRMHKNRGTLTTHKDPEGRPTVFDNIPDHMGRVISVGRLDMNTEGLLLLTNDGALARWMELPANALVRRYRVRVYGRVNEAALARLKDGATINGVHYGEVEASLERTSKKSENDAGPQQSTANTWVSVAIREGKNREVRKLMEHLGLTVNRLIRTHYGPFTLGSVPLGGISQVNSKQLREVMPDFFANAPDSVAAPAQKRDTSKWAKAKKPTGNKPGAVRRRAIKVAERMDAPITGRSPKPSNRPSKSTDRSKPTDRKQATTRTTAAKGPRTGTSKTAAPNKPTGSNRPTGPNKASGPNRTSGPGKASGSSKPSGANTGGGRSRKPKAK